MKKFITVLCLSILFFARVYANDAKPNIIFILIDDLGKEWLNCYGGENIETPNIDKLAATGMKFHNAYSMPQCTPSRVCFMTGQYPYNNGWINHWDAPRWGAGYYDWNKNPSIARTMKNAGYKTAVAGKWQLNDFRVHPNAMTSHGFDDYFMWTGGEGSKDKTHTRKSDERYWGPYIHSKAGSKTYPGKFGPDLYNDFVLDFIEKNKDDPFFIYYPMALTHGPLVHTPLEPNVKDKLGKHKAMIRYTDFLLGKIVKKLEDLQIRKKTIIVWTTDNGTSGSFKNMMNGRMVKGGKTKTTENGVNAPFIVNCPGMVPVKETQAIVDFTDMHRTFADFAGVEPESGYKYDGFSQKDVFLGKKEKSARSYILAMGSHPGRSTDNGVENVYYFRDRVIRNERYKLFIGTDKKPEKLIDLSKDPEEENNLIKDPSVKQVLDAFKDVVESLPSKDKDPVYEKLPANDWDKKPEFKSQEHKKDQPKEKVN